MSGGLHVLPEYNVQERNKDAVMLVDELTSTEYYIGISWNRADQSKPTWRIKRIWKVGTSSSIYFTIMAYSSWSCCRNV